MSDLAEFLLARIAEDEAAVPPEYASEDYGSGFNADQIAFEVSPRRWLAECEAKRRIVELAGIYADAQAPDYAGGYRSAMDEVLSLLAMPYADHADYRQEWAVQ